MGYDGGNCNVCLDPGELPEPVWRWLEVPQGGKDTRAKCRRQSRPLLDQDGMQGFQAMEQK